MFKIQDTLILSACLKDGNWRLDGRISKCERSKACWTEFYHGKEEKQRELLAEFYAGIPAKPSRIKSTNKTGIKQNLPESVQRGGRKAGQRRGAEKTTDKKSKTKGQKASAKSSKPMPEKIRKCTIENCKSMAFFTCVECITDIFCEVHNAHHWSHMHETEALPENGYALKEAGKKLSKESETYDLPKRQKMKEKWLKRYVGYSKSSKKKFESSSDEDEFDDILSRTEDEDHLKKGKKRKPISKPKSKFASKHKNNEEDNMSSTGKQQVSEEEVQSDISEQQSQHSKEKSGKKTGDNIDHLNKKTKSQSESQLDDDELSSKQPEQDDDESEDEDDQLKEDDDDSSATSEENDDDEDSEEEVKCCICQMVKSTEFEITF